MFNSESLFLQGLIFSGLSLSLIAVSTWWLYLSPMKAAADAASRISPWIAIVLALIIGVSSILRSFGTYWDASQHVVTGIVPGGDDFLWPPHLLIYASFLLSLVVVLSALFLLAVPNLRAGIRDPRQWVRRNPYVGAVALATGYALLSIPGDAIWHEIFGIDLTAWSPPHVLLMLASEVEILCAIGLLLQTHPWTGGVDWRDMAVVVLITMMLHELLIIGTIEWEFEEMSRAVAFRPIWLYPFLSGVAAFFAVALACRITALRWTATFTAVLFFTWRLATWGIITGINGAAPKFSLVFLLGAILLDVVYQADIRSPTRRTLAAVAAFTAGYAVVAWPTLAFLRNDLPAFTRLDYGMALVLVFVACLLLQPLVNGIGAWLLHYQTPIDALEAGTPLGPEAPSPAS